MINAYSTLYRMDMEAVLDNTKYAGMSYRPMSLAEKLGLVKQESEKQVKPIEKKEEKKVEKKVEKKEEKKEEKVEKKEEKKVEKKVLESGVCGIDVEGVKHMCGDNSATVFSILDPQFNLREACKNMLLLENSLMYYGNGCQECLLKHALTVEGFLEEAYSLDTKKEFKAVIDKILTAFRKIFKMMVNHMKKDTLDSKKCSELSDEISKIRKPLCQQFGMYI